MPLRPSALFSLLLTVAAGTVSAVPLQEASISKIVNEVKVVDPKAGGRAARLEETIKNDLGVKTGVDSRAELRFQDDTLTRLGAETFFSFSPGTREMSLREGTMLLQVPKEHGGARIKTAAVTASITGTTIMMEYWPGKTVKVLVLEGSLRLSVNGRIGETLMLTPGKMILMKPTDRHLPEPVNVDLAKLVKTSSLIDPAAFKGKSKMRVDPLPSLALIQKEVDVQLGLKQHAGLVETNVLIPGKGSAAVLASHETMAALDQSVAVTTKPEQTLALNERAQTEKHQAVIAATRPHNAPAGPSTGKSPGADQGVSFQSEGPAGDQHDDKPAHGGDLHKPAPEAPSLYTTPVSLPPPTGVLTGTLSRQQQSDLTITTPSTAGQVSFATGGDLSVTAPVTANAFGFYAKNNAVFDATVQAGALYGAAGKLIAFHQAVGANTLRLQAPQVSAASLSAATSLSIWGTLVGGGADNLLVSPSINIAGGINLDGADGQHGSTPTAAGDGKALTIQSDVFYLNGGYALLGVGVSAITANGGKSVQDGVEGGGGGTVRIGTQPAPISGDVYIGSSISATTGENGKHVSYGGTGGTVDVVANGAISVSGIVRVSSDNGKAASKSGGIVRLTSRRVTGTAINLTSSGQLLSLLNAAAPGPGGRIELTSAGGNIYVSGNARADHGTIEIQNNGNGLIALQNATLSGDVVKAGALGPNGQLVIGGGNISADTAIKLYADGANGSVLFNSNTTLSGTSLKTIAGDTVTIANHKNVNVNGPAAAQVFTNHANYSGSGGNGSTSGQFTGKGATTAPFSGRPSF